MGNILGAQRSHIHGHYLGELVSLLGRPQPTCPISQPRRPTPPTVSIGLVYRARNEETPPYPASDSLPLSLQLPPPSHHHLSALSRPPPPHPNAIQRPPRHDDQPL